MVNDSAIQYGEHCGIRTAEQLFAIFADSSRVKGFLGRRYSYNGEETRIARKSSKRAVLDALALVQELQVSGLAVGFGSQMDHLTMGLPPDWSSATLCFFLTGAPDKGLSKYSSIQFGNFLLGPTKPSQCKLQMKPSPSGSHFFPFTADLVRLICASVVFLVSSGIRAMLCSVRILADLGQSVNLHPHTSDLQCPADTFPYGYSSSKRSIVDETSPTRTKLYTSPY